MYNFSNNLYIYFIAFIRIEFNVVLHREKKGKMIGKKKKFLHYGLYYDEKNIIFALDQNSAAGKCGSIRVGDVIIRINGKETTSSHETSKAIKTAGEDIEIALKRIPYNKSKFSLLIF